MPEITRSGDQETRIPDGRPSPRGEYSPVRSGILEGVLTALFAVVAFVSLHFTVQTYKVEMSSMEPSIMPGWWIVVSKVSYRLHPPERGDVVVLKPPADVGQDLNGEMLIKRIIGLPGDTVAVRDGKVYVNGIALSEPYIVHPAHYSMASRLIPPGQYFVLGDNRDVSVDSHLGWLVPRQHLSGKGWILVWPPDRWGSAPNHAFGQPPAFPLHWLYYSP